MPVEFSRVLCREFEDLLKKANVQVDDAVNAARFLCENGLLLDVEDPFHHRGVSELYILAAVWLCNMVARVRKLKSKRTKRQSIQGVRWQHQLGHQSLMVVMSLFQFVCREVLEVELRNCGCPADRVQLCLLLLERYSRRRSMSQSTLVSNSLAIVDLRLHFLLTRKCSLCHHV